jgi:hypothetical protein
LATAKNLYLHLFTNCFVFLFFPAVMFAIVNIVKASGSTAVDPYVLAGMMIMAGEPGAGRPLTLVRARSVVSGFWLIDGFLGKIGWKHFPPRSHAHDRRFEYHDGEGPFLVTRSTTLLKRPQSWD